ncbi:MAG: endo alpha-1,4 polygalactosaminidase [Myxococcales bacterium]|nr:endo alpha-1,4 polygalactosaminidase [Myxococcales bacterium]
MLRRVTALAVCSVVACAPGERAGSEAPEAGVDVAVQRERPGLDVATQQDASPLDAVSPQDRGAVDVAVQRDLAPSDLGPAQDRPSLDAGSVDAGSVDAGSVDAGSVDAGGRDAVTGPVSPASGARWHIDLEAPVVETVDADWFDIDLFDNTAAVVERLHRRGRRVVCYFSAGSDEDWRPDHGRFAASAVGRALDGWPGERWLDVRAASVRAVMLGRLDRARAMGCDGVDPDNVDGYTQASGFSLSASDQLAYNRFLASEAHRRGLVVGLKNDLDQVDALAADFDFAINESCFAYRECGRLGAFVQRNKSVLQIEYGDAARLALTVCPGARSMGFFSILPGADRLDGRYRRCSDGQSVP